MKPFIGITTSFQGEDYQIGSYLRATYSNEIRRAGGTPVLLPHNIPPEEAGEYTAKLDGLLFSGGGDLSPHYFNEEPIRELVSFFSIRDVTELSLMREAQQIGLPLLGICRGCQLINVALGGSLYQDIPRQVPDSIGHYPKGTPHYEPYHNISILPGESHIASIVKQPSIRTNSFHHQSVKDLAPGLKVTAKSCDGIIEAFEGTDPSWYVNCVQFHPETMCEKHPEFRAFFTHFVNFCENRTKSKK
ncbi:MAG: gamma-glutamyl-gamma-aminobutyrate hydrolase family protein [Treponema sp.]|nr:gamma-glutamyl-gamma-aminobutyrate hydrolase family protein [Treponema sp.]